MKKADAVLKNVVKRIIKDPKKLDCDQRHALDVPYI